MNLYYFGNALGLSSLYMIAGLGGITAIKNGEFNLGGEGQIYTGGFVCAILLNYFGNNNIPAIIALPAAILLAMTAAALLGFISSTLKNYKNASPLFTSFIISAATIPFIDGLIAGKFRTTTGNLLATAFIKPEYRFSSIMPPSSCNIWFILAIGLCIGAYYFFTRSSFGRKLCIMGISNEFAQYSGFNNHRISDLSFIISAGMHGLCGAVTVCGTYFTCHSGFYAGIGWNALSAALIASSNPILLIPSSIILAFIITYANKFALFNNMGFDISSIIQGVVLLLIALGINLPRPAFLGGKK